MKCRCILTLDAGKRMGIFEEGKLYEFFESDLSDHIGKSTMRNGWELTNHYTVVSDTGSTHTFSTSEFDERFVDIKEHRDKKINKILNG
jgi:glycogen synthase